MRLRLIDGSNIARSLFVACASLCVVATAARADVRVKIRDTAWQGSEQMLYLKGSLQRRDTKAATRDGRTFNWSLINDCARQQFIWLDSINHRYWLDAGGVPMAAFAAFDEQQFPPFTPPKAKGTLTELVTVTDTGERREMFGFTARHLKTTTTWVSSEADSCAAGQARIETDGWYVDLLHGVDCSPDLSGATPRMLGVTNTCLGKRMISGRLAFRRKIVGGARPGFPIAEATRVYDERKLIGDFRRDVLELSTEPIDDAIFVVPAGYVLVAPQEIRKQSLFERALSIFR